MMTFYDDADTSTLTDRYAVIQAKTDPGWIFLVFRLEFIFTGLSVPSRKDVRNEFVIFSVLR